MGDRLPSRWLSSSDDEWLNILSGATPMISLGDGRWIKALALPPGTYEYRLVVDGEWSIPFARSLCVEIDPVARRIAVDLPEGLKDLNRT